MNRQLEFRGTQWLRQRGYNPNGQPAVMPELHLMAKDCRDCGGPIWLLRVDMGWMLFERIWGYKRGLRVHQCNPQGEEPRANLDQTPANSITG